ncbi:MAG: heat-inducible transcriptional repressor HrcA, partial [Acidobacteriota bacterium]
MKEIQLDRRGQDVLEAVIVSYTETGEPVGSRTVSRLNREGLSAATIRNVMAELEERDLLSQPHPSAGRVPTDLGYRVYVDSLMKRRRLAHAEEHLIESTLREKRARPDDVFNEVSRILSRLSRHMGVVVSPHFARARLKDAEFVRLGPHRILVIIVAASGMIYN